MNKIIVITSFILLASCNSNDAFIKPSVETISESIYASGTVKAAQQYDAYAMMNGVVDQWFVSEGDWVEVGTPILSITNETQKLNKENAALLASYSEIQSNKGKIADAKLKVDLAKNKMLNDSLLYFRQKKLFEQEIGSQIDMEQRTLAYENSKSLYFSSKVNLADLERLVAFNAAQSKKNLQISKQIESDYILKSKLKGKVFAIHKKPGEIITTQLPAAIIGSGSDFILEMQVDENDILKVKIGSEVSVIMDSYKGKEFEARVSKVIPIMNEKTKTFKIEAVFQKLPENIYPNLSFEANILLRKKEHALVIPRSYLLNGSYVMLSSGEKVKVKTGLMDYEKVEIVSGINKSSELIMPEE